MSKYGKIYEDAVERKAEVTCEEFYTYFLVVFNSYPSKGGLRICRLEVMELCEIHNLDYKNTSRRLIRLRTGEFAENEPPKKVEPMKSPWLYRTNDFHLLPLVGIQEDEIVNNTIFMQKEIVKNTMLNRKKYDKKRVKIVNNTIALKEDLKNSLRSSHTNKKIGVGVNFENGHKSIFELEECIRYAEICKSNGDDNIKSTLALGKSLYYSGDSDAYIQKTLYPETLTETPPEAKSDANKDGCPRCYGTGMEYFFGPDGEDLGVRPGCKHEPLRPGEYLYEWKADDDIS